MQKIKWPLFRIVSAALIAGGFMEFFPEHQKQIEMIFYFILGLIIGSELSYGKTLTGDLPALAKALIVLTLIALSIFVAFSFPALQSIALLLPGILAGPFLKEILVSHHKGDLSKGT